jgi:hypothetical protein
VIYEFSWRRERKKLAGLYGRTLSITFYGNCVNRRFHPKSLARQNFSCAAWMPRPRGPTRIPSVFINSKGKLGRY